MRKRFSEAHPRPNRPRARLHRHAATVSLAALILLAALCAIGVSSAAAAPSPWWQLRTNVRPANLALGGEGTIVVKAINLGDEQTSGPVTLTDTLPAGIEVVEEEHGGEMVPHIELRAFSFAQGQLDLGTTGFFAEEHSCKVNASTVSCTPPIEGITAEGALTAHVAPYESLEMLIRVKVQAAASAPNRAEVTGGEAHSATDTRPLTVTSAPTPFAVEDLSLIPEEDGGEPDAQAGSHPFQLTTTLALNQTADPAKPPALPRNLTFRLPAGLVGNTTALPQCADLDFRDLIGGTGTANRCPENTVVGVAVLTVDEPVTLHLQTLPVPLFNLVPGKGEPARFGFEFAGTPVTLDTSVRTGSDYGVNVDVSNITQLTSFLSSTVTFWGVPGDPRHDHSRGWGCLARDHWSSSAGGAPCVPASQPSPPPFLTLPTSCPKTPFTATVEGDSWPIKAAPGAEPASLPLTPVSYSLKDGFGRELGLTGCNQLPFAPTVEAQPDVSQGSSSTGLTVHVRVPQEVATNPEGLSSSNVKDISVTLPEGMALNPSGADGLQACSTGQVGFTGPEPVTGNLLFTPTLASPFCPDASKIGTVDIATPLLPATQHLKGAVYLAAQNANPFGSLIAMYIVAEDPISGVVLKLPGSASLDPVTGRITATFKNNPQLPFEDAELHFFGGERAPLATPAHCGTYTTNAAFTPWSAEPSDEAAVTTAATSTFNITSGPNGSPCPGPSLPFSPSLTGGTTNINAGSFSPLTTTIGREDGQQNMQSVQLRMPLGLSGILAGVPLCPDAQANAGTCSPASQIGETTVSAGVGSDPVSVTGGKVYITEKYAGAPFGLSIVNPVKAGPFDLERDTSNPAQNPACDCVVVRATIDVDTSTAALTITTDASGPHAIPHLIDGIPVQIKKVNVLINRPGFTFNPTNCNPAQIAGAITGGEGASSPVAVPFQVTNCKNLEFKPKFAVSTSGKTSKANGASLAVKLTYPNAPFGSQANIRSVKVDLPKQLPSRLTTLQKACTNAQFVANPAGCPAASFIGHAKAITPLLPVPLEGPAIFVSHGGEAFPSLIIVLQGYGVTIDLVGTTFISKAGITSSTFKTVPDQPIGSFELNLPQGKYSALAANGNLCTSSLRMPTEFLAQNGAKIDQNTSVSVTGCAKKKGLTRAQKLAAALKVCKKKAKGKRAACRASARKRYGPPAKQKAKPKAKKK